MFDLQGVNKRYFGVTLHLEDESKIEINVEPPKLKVLKRLTSLAKAKEEEDVIENLEGAITDLLNKNKEKIKVDKYVEEFSIDEMQQLLTAFFKWLNQEKNSKN